MASILKNQIIKHLSAFARNLKPEQITMEVLRGKGQLRDLELNEDVLTEKLELPPWLKIVSARCDRVSINIPSWRKLRSAPIKLFVDELRVSVRLVSSKTYNLADRVIETLSLYVQSVEVFFESDSAADFGFGGSITLYSLALESIRPNWSEEKDVDINSTRIHDKTIRQVLFFKQLSWRLLKIEASAHSKYGADEQREPLKSKTNSPLRLLTVDGKCRISIKKSSQNCTLLAGKIELILKEIHWLATMLHLRMAIDFHKHILDLANCQKREDSKLFGQQQNPFMDASSCMPTATAVPCAAFRQLDIPQSSHHLSISKVDLLLLDDSESNMLPSDWKLEKGAMQAFLHRLRIDFYPENRVFDPTGDIAHRHHWTHYQSPNSFTDLARLQLDQHFRVISTKLDANKRERFARVWPQLVSQNVVIRLDNIVLQQVTDQKTKKDALRDMFSMDKKSKDRMPHSMSFLHLELSSYAFPASNAFTVPPDSVHLVMAPLELSPDAKSIRWMPPKFVPIRRDRLDDKHFNFVDWAERNTVEVKLADELRRKSSKFLPKCNDNADFILEHSKRNEWILSIPSLWINCDFGPNTWELPFLTDLNIFGSIVLDGTDPSLPANSTSERRKHSDGPDKFRQSILPKKTIHLRLILPSGPAPSPYDLKWSCANDGVSPSNTSISCSDLPVDESASNSAQFPPCRRVLLFFP
uniref:Chorein_N domain-containing protein n=1 Tax=Globodera pallida TaxID=36090 RepID=A0A183BVR1_GLOPA